MDVHALSPNLRHVAHIHGVPGAHDVCPPAPAQKLPPVIVPLEAEMPVACGGINR